MKVRRTHAVMVLLGLALGVILLRTIFKSAAVGAVRSLNEKKSVSERVLEFGAPVHRRLGGRFGEIGVPYPPKKLVLLALKNERALEVWVADANGQFQFLKTYPILGASGTLGPKLAEGDCQVPEGLYKIESLNPNSLYHLALRIGYPNAADREHGTRDGRTNLGSDIMIHGKSASVGCLAMGDEAAEDLFVLAAETGIENIAVILSPVDFRVRGLPPGPPHVPEWTGEVYADIQREMAKLSGPKNALTPTLRADR